MKKYRGIFLKNLKELGLMREANRMVARILDELGASVRPGVRTIEFEEIALARCKDFGVKPAFLGYQGFPFALCCSINEEVVHGFPSKDRELKEGDIVSFDMGVVHKGFVGDAARTYPVGRISEKAERLLSVTEKALALGIEKAQVGNNVYDISKAIQACVESAGFGVVRRFVGHGVGIKLHEKPEVPNFVPEGHPGVVLKSGMVLAIEPMVTEGVFEVEVLSDRWTAVTKDRGLAAHFEHSVAITAEGPEILSLSE